ncbi:hypothetical protein TNCV_4092271 [Trichonephila clavipes]|nr:hypothetical protein TNCV_4092271 [Trichonephila clavipes]
MDRGTQTRDTRAYSPLIRDHLLAFGKLPVWFETVSINVKLQNDERRKKETSVIDFPDSMRPTARQRSESSIRFLEVIETVLFLRMDSDGNLFCIPREPSFYGEKKILQLTRNLPMRKTPSYAYL